MNCYYSNLIEGHNTHPRDIDGALTADYSNDPHRRDLQLGARIEMRQMIDAGSAASGSPATRAFIQWTHQEFCSRLPESLLVVKNPDTGEQLRLVPGQLRARSVSAGRHIPPPAEDLPAFMCRFEEAYDATRLSEPRRAVGTLSLEQYLDDRLAHGPSYFSRDRTQAG
jgi:Fic family protein